MIDLKTLDVLQVALLLCLTVVAMTVTCPIAQAQPRTMYKPQDIENARQNLERYEWAQAIVRAWEGRVQYAMEQDREFFEELISELTPGNSSGQYCPVCINPVTRTGGNLTWSVTAPETLVCRQCGTVYPNADYPETGVLEARRMGQTFTYYQTPEERALGPDATAKERAEHAFWWLGNRPQATSFSGLIRWRRVQWAIGQTLPLAKLYTLTGDIAYAERVA